MIQDLFCSGNTLFTHPHPNPPLEGEGGKYLLSFRERIKVRVG